MKMKCKYEIYRQSKKIRNKSGLLVEKFIMTSYTLKDCCHYIAELHRKYKDDGYVIYKIENYSKYFVKADKGYIKE